MKSVLYILLATALTYGTSMAAGRLLSRLLGLRLDRFPTFVAGSAILSTLIFFLTASGLAYKGVFLALAVLILGAAAIAGARERPTRSATARVREAFLLSGSVHWLWVAAFWIVYLTFGWVYLSHALAPEASPDGVAYHVGLITRYYREHHFPRITTDFYASFPAGVEMLFLFAFSIGRHSAAAMVEFLYLTLTPFGILAWGRRAGCPTAALAAALLFYVSPVVGRDGTVAYVDVATAAIAFALFYLLQVWRERPSKRLLIVAGIVAGFGGAAKYTQVVGLIYGIGIVVFYSWRRRDELLKSVAAFGLCASLVIAPWLLKNAIVVSNPVSPFLNRIFPNRYVYASFEKEYFDGRLFGGNGGAFEVGPVFLLLPLGLLALRRSAARQALLAGIVFGAPCLAAVDVRFLIPALPFAALVLALAASSVRGLTGLLVVAQVVLCWPPVVTRYAPLTWHIEGPVWNAALRRIPESQYLRERVDSYDLVPVLRDDLPRDARILSESMFNLAYQPRDLIVPAWSAFGMRLGSVLDQARSEGARPTRRIAFRFAERPLGKIRLALVDCGADLWAVSEVRVFHGDAEILRDPAWRLRAWPNPWEVQFAFDGSPITIWNARQYRPRGAFIEIDFRSGQRVAGLTADLPANLKGCVMRVETEGEDGRWAPLMARITIENAPYPARFRQAVIEEIKANGIGWMVLHDTEQLAMDFLERPSQWGITAVAYRNGYRLWRLD